MSPWHRIVEKGVAKSKMVVAALRSSLLFLRNLSITMVVVRKNYGEKSRKGYANYAPKEIGQKKK